MAVDKSMCDKIITIKEKKSFRTYDEMEKYYDQPSGTIAQIVTYKRNPSKKLIKSMLRKDISSEWWYNDIEPIFRDLDNLEDTQPCSENMKHLIESNKILTETNAMIVEKLIKYIDREEK